MTNTAPDKAARLDRQGPESWLAAAREALIIGGVSRVKVAVLAEAMGVTTGSFYWHFKDRSQLLARLIEDWETSSSAGMVAAVAEHDADPDAQFEALAEVWVEERDYSPGWDAAMRHWARTDQNVEAAVRRVDERRINLWRGIFRRMGYEEPEALVRSRITYFHQVGYYALSLGEDRTQRLALKPVYLEVLKGRLARK